ncbi:MAG: metal ABC transporter substrate-binding protein [Planctomycetota bacterium]|jgi:zinc transport system substrate-binding protein
MSTEGRIVPLFFIVAVCGLTTACSPRAASKSAEGEGSGVKTVFTDNYPVAYFAQRIAGDSVKVVFPAPKDGDPAFWEPGEEDIAAYQKSDLILMNGAGYAKWADKASLPEGKIVDTSRTFRDEYLEITGTVTHSHGISGDHAHAGCDFNTWVDPVNAKKQAREIQKALTRLRPELEKTFEKNCLALVKDLDSLDAKFKALGENGEKRPMVASHPVYNYVARRYGWNLKSLKWEPQEMPSKEGWAALKKILKDHRAAWMIWEGEPDPAIVAQLEKDHGVRSAVFDQCGNRPDVGDYLSVMRRNVENLKPVFHRD